MNFLKGRRRRASGRGERIGRDRLGEVVDGQRAVDRLGGALRAGGALADAAGGADADGDWRDQVEGYPLVGPMAFDAKVIGPTVRLPSCE